MLRVLNELSFLTDGKALVHSLQVNYIHQVLQARLVDHPNPLAEVYTFLHYFCQSLQLEVGTLGLTLNFTRKGVGE
jgi:mediator of RNA polymerase II transcription subunit 14